MEDFVTLSRLEYEQLKAQTAELTELKAFVEQLKAEIALLKNGGIFSKPFHLLCK
jgi:cell division protein FtsB